MSKRQSIRLDKYNYGNAGYYFITIDTEKKGNIFGYIRNRKIIKNKIGELEEKIWQEIKGDYENLELDEYIIMPDHIHGIIRIKFGGIGRRNIELAMKQDVGAPLVGAQYINMAGINRMGRAGTRPARTCDIRGGCDTNKNEIIDTKKQSRIENLNLGIIIGEFKSKFINQYAKNVKLLNWPRYEKCFWQRNYFEEIIKDQNGLENVRKYIRNNPVKLT